MKCSLLLLFSLCFALLPYDVSSTLYQLNLCACDILEVNVSEFIFCDCRKI